ncbi:hypothetical protein GCM10009623_34250 [Nocardioides aestuarii]|uniref:DUF3618 domain-containing protein n=1 Tax=Nocardioides aestuarii TaxID=252231 RepID=A0ABW4TSD5_9ACTN
MSHRRPEQIEAEIEAQREQLAATVDELTHKLDVKDRMTTDNGRPRPQLVAAAGAAIVVVVAVVLWRRR